MTIHSYRGPDCKVTPSDYSPELHVLHIPRLRAPVIEREQLQRQSRAPFPLPVLPNKDARIFFYMEITSIARCAEQDWLEVCICDLDLGYVYAARARGLPRAL